MASCPGSVEARAQIYLEQCPLHLKFSWSQVFLERKDDQRMISLHSRAQTNFEASMVYGQSVFCSDNQQKMKLSRTFLATAEFHCPYSNLKGHSFKRCLSNYVLDLDLNMQKQFSSILSYFSRMKEVVALVFFWQEKPVLPCKSANSTVARFSQYPTQSIQRKAADGPYALEG